MLLHFAQSLPLNKRVADTIMLFAHWSSKYVDPRRGQGQPLSKQ